MVEKAWSLESNDLDLYPDSVSLEWFNLSRCVSSALSEGNNNACITELLWDLNLHNTPY